MSEPFRAVEWMRRRRAEIDEQDKACSWSEKSEATLEALESDPLWQRLKSRLAEPPPRRPSVPSEGHVAS